MLEAPTVMMGRVEMVLVPIAPHGYYGMRSSMHSDSITKLYAVLILTATTSSEVREVSHNMHLDLTGRATMVGDGNPA